MVRSLAQQEAAALQLIRNAYAVDYTSDALAVDFAVAALGEDSRALVERVFADKFKIAGPT